MFVIALVLRIFWFLLLARVIFSWIRPTPSSPIYPVVDFVERATEPILAPIRRVLPPMGGLDLSSLLVMLVLGLFLIPLAQRL